MGGTTTLSGVGEAPESAEQSLQIQTRMTLTRLLTSLPERLSAWWHAVVEVSRKHLRAGVAGYDIPATHEVQERLLRQVLHELNNRITPITGLSSFLAERHSESSSHALLNASCNLIQIFLERVQTWLQQGKISIDKSPVNLSDLLSPIMALLKEEDTNKSLNLIITQSVPNTISTDPEILVQIILNLAENAIKYSDPGGVVNIRVAFENGLLRISVEDHGIGIAEKDIPHIFDHGFRAAHKYKKGTGIGLGVVKKLVTAMNGTMNVQSTVGEGTTFTVCILAEGVN